jgi:hypothetical protein
MRPARVGVRQLAQNRSQLRHHLRRRLRKLHPRGIAPGPNDARIERAEAVAQQRHFRSGAKSPGVRKRAPVRERSTTVPPVRLSPTTITIGIFAGWRCQRRFPPEYIDMLGSLSR